jgi:hypothetical protein
MVVLLKKSEKRHKFSQILLDVDGGTIAPSSPQDIVMEESPVLFDHL